MISVIILSVAPLSIKYRKKQTLSGDLPTNKKIQFGQEFELLTNNVSCLTHSIHKYPSKFIPQIPRWAIQKYLHAKTKLYVFDPMCGSGTTLLESMIQNQNSVGLDIDPLACLISKVKTTPISDQILEPLTNNFKNKISRRKKGQFLPKIDNLEHWFTGEPITKLSIIRDIIEEYRDSKDIYDFLLIVFSSIIRRTSNADNQSQKTYVSHNITKIPSDPNTLFIQRLTKYSEQIKQLSKLKPKTKHFVYNFDSRQTNLKSKIKKNSFDLAITSPPYIKAIDYIYTNMAEYFWIGDVFGLDTRQQQNLHKQNYIGTKQVYSNEYYLPPSSEINEINNIVQRIQEKNQKFSYITAKFFVDIKNNLQSTRDLLKQNSHYVMVVGNCSVNGINIPVAKLICKLAEISGFEITNLFSYVIRNRFMRFPRQGRGGLITHDIVIDMCKK